MTVVVVVVAVLVVTVILVVCPLQQPVTMSPAWMIRARARARARAIPRYSPVIPEHSVCTIYFQDGVIFHPHNHHNHHNHQRQQQRRRHHRYHQLICPLPSTWRKLSEPDDSTTQAPLPLVGPLTPLLPPFPRLTPRTLVHCHPWMICNIRRNSRHC